MKRKPIHKQIKLFEEITVDSFAGGGGASAGIALAIGGSVDIAINHDPVAIALHMANHPDTEHYCENVWDVDPRKAAAGRPVALCWLSPDCRHFSKAKGQKPKEKKIRGLAWVGVRWGATVHPRVTIMENVEEIQDWGPLLQNGHPDPKRKGRTFKTFVNALRYQGYEVKWKELRACDYGAPTSRKRLFLIARCDGRPIVWPKPTHGHPDSADVKSGKLKPWRTAAEIINWDLPCPSVFDTAEEIKKKYGTRVVRPLADNTMRRIARGVDKYVINNPEPFICRQFGNSVGHSINVPLGTVVAGGCGKSQLVMPFLTQYHGYKSDGARGQKIDKPLLTIDTSPRYALTAVFISKYYGTAVGSDLKEPLHTVTSKDRNALIVSHLVKMKGTNIGQPVNQPLQTITAGGLHYGDVRTLLTKVASCQDMGRWLEVRDLLNKYCGYQLSDDEILLFQINEDLYFISDIGLRMLEPRELFAAQGFPADYIIDRDYKGNRLSKAAQVAMCGNSVPPALAEALTRANLPELCGGRAGLLQTEMRR